MFYFQISWPVQVTKVMSLFSMKQFFIQERLQFLIEPVDSERSNIIDSLLVNLDNLRLGGDFTEEMMFTGFHNISTMTMSFRVECSPGFCGPDCLTTPINNPLVAQCQTDGSATCVDSKRNSSANILCSNCLYNLNISTNCSTCLEDNYDPVTNCQSCLPNYDSTTDCSLCTDRRYDPNTDCTSCLNTGYNPFDSCMSCLREFYDPQTNCTKCLPNRDPSFNCTQCLPGWNINSNCMNCMPNKDPQINCIQCLPGWDITSNCTQCVSGFTGNNCEPSE